MKKGLFGLKRAAIIVVALSATFMMSVPAAIQDAFAAQIQSTSVEMSSSTASATAVSYDITFTPQTSVAAGGGIVVDICEDTPIVGSTTCAYPSGFGFSWGSATPTLVLNGGMGSGWTAAGVQGGATSGAYQTLELTSSTGTLTGGGSTPASFTISSVVNPSGTYPQFYARILTFDTSAHMTSQYTVSGTTRAATFANMVDYGGAAMETASTIAITASVMQTLTFCTSSTAPGTGCGSNVTTPNITLGTGTPATLGTSAVSTIPAYNQVSTNAQGGIVVRMKGTTLTSGSNTIPAANSGLATAPSTGITAGTAAFGMYCSAGPGETASNPYASGGSSYYGLDTTSATSISSTYGSPVETSSGPLNSSNSTLTFGGTASNTTPAGIYTANMVMIATGTF